MLYREYKPHPGLEEHIKCFWMLEKEYDSNNRVELVFPDSYIELIVNYGVPYKQMTTAGLKALSPAFLIGLLTKPLSLFSNGLTKIVCARFFPWGAYAFFPSFVKESHDNASAVDFKIGTLTPRIEALMESGDYEAAVKELEKALLEFSVANFYEQELVKNASKYLFLKKGQCRIEEVAEYCYRSLRQVQRSFTNGLGVSMKSMSKNFRFDEIKKQLIKDPDINLTQLAYEFGFFDQAHFTREFKNFTGKTPSEFCAEMKMIRSTWGENVVFLQ